MNQTNVYPGKRGGAALDMRALLLACLMHGMLLFFLWFGIRWQNKQASAVEAEVWDLSTREAAAVVAPPVSEEEKAPEPVAQPVVDAPPPELIIEQERQKKVREAKMHAQEAQRKEADLAAEKKKKELQKQAEEKRARDQLFAENMRRLTGMAEKPGYGTAAKSTGNNRGEVSYIAKIAAKVRSNTIYNVADTVSGNPTVEYRIELLPDGSLRGPVKRLKSSGVAGFDDAVAKGIEKSAPFPRDQAGRMPPSIDLVYRMKEE